MNLPDKLNKGTCTCPRAQQEGRSCEHMGRRSPKYLKHSTKLPAKQAQRLGSFLRPGQWIIYARRKRRVLKGWLGFHHGAALVETNTAGKDCENRILEPRPTCPDNLASGSGSASNTPRNRVGRPRRRLALTGESGCERECNLGSVTFTEHMKSVHVQDAMQQAMDHHLSTSKRQPLCRMDLPRSLDCHKRHSNHQLLKNEPLYSKF